MAYDEDLASRVRVRLAAEAGVAEKKMFGGLTFMLNGNMCCGVAKEDLMLRVGVEQEPAALARPHARPCDFTGRPMKGLILVAPAGVKTDKALAAWLKPAVAFASSLPAK